MIHTDFKPENVVICLRDEEVIEINKTGQLTTTKMGKNEHIKNMNMKVAGTLGHLKPKKEVNEADTSITQSESKSINNVWDMKLFEGLTAKQKKNLRKKLQRQRKKQEKLDNSQIQSSQTSSIDNGGSANENDISGVEINEQEIGDIDIDVGKKSGKKEVEEDEENKE